MQGLILLTASYLAEIVARKRFLQNILMYKQQNEIIKQKTINEKLQRKLLENMLPPGVVDKLQQQQKEDQLESAAAASKLLNNLSQRHLGVSILFADLAEFTALTSQIESIQVMVFLNELFEVFDALCDGYNVYKVETVGDCYVAAVGVVTGVVDALEVSEQDIEVQSVAMKRLQSYAPSKRTGAARNTESMLGFAQAILRESKRMMLPGVGHPATLRIGIHTGPCMSGIVGTKNLRLCLFGDTMNVAARMKQKGTADRIHVTEDVVDLAPDYDWDDMAPMAVKGKGMMKTYLLAMNDGDREMLSPEPRSHLSPIAESPVHRLSPQALHSLGRSHGSDGRAAEQLEHLLTLTSMRYAMGRPRKQPSLFETNVSMKVYKKNTYGLLFFRNRGLESLFLDAHARLTKNDVYIGYALMFMAGCLNYIAHLVGYSYASWVCSDPANSVPCTQLAIGQGGWSLQEVAYNSFVDDMYGQVLVSFVVGGVVGSVGHFLIHRIKRIKSKAWAFLISGVCYFLVVLTNIFLSAYGNFQFDTMVINFQVSPKPPTRRARIQTHYHRLADRPHPRHTHSLSRWFSSSVYCTRGSLEVFSGTTSFCGQSGVQSTWGCLFLSYPQTPKYIWTQSRRRHQKTQLFWRY